VGREGWGREPPVPGRERREGAADMVGGRGGSGMRERWHAARGGRLWLGFVGCEGARGVYIPAKVG
jgi:hypothetical protein